MNLKKMNITTIILKYIFLIIIRKHSLMKINQTKIMKYH